MIAIEGAVIRAQFDKPPLGTLRDTGGSAIFELRHRFAPWMEAIVSASHTEVLGRRTDEFVAGPVFHLNHTFALGAFYRHVERQFRLRSDRTYLLLTMHRLRAARGRATRFRGARAACSPSLKFARRADAWNCQPFVAPV